MTTRSRLRAAASLSLAGALALTGCGSAPDRSGDKADSASFPTSLELEEGFDPEGHFTYGYTAFATSWDPIASINGNDLTFYAPVYDRLLAQDGDGTVTPMLAESFTPASDNSSLTLKLRQGLTFSDGTPFDAAAVKANLDRARGDGSKIKGELYQVTDVQVVDPYTVEIAVSGGIGSLAVALASRPGVMVSPAAVQQGTLQSQPVGIGPYQATDITPGDRVTFEKTADYWDPDAQRVSQVTYRLMLDDQTRLNALMTGQIDGANLNGDQLATAADAGLNIVSKPSVQFLYFAVNTAYEPFDDPEVRKALNMAFDREAISEGLYDGNCTPQIQPYPESSIGYSDEIGDGLDTYPYDPEKAKQVLVDGGVTDLEITAVNANSTSLMQFAEVVQSQLADIGITVNVKSEPAEQVVQHFAIDKSAEAISTNFTGMNDPDAMPGRYMQQTALINPGAEDYSQMLEYAAEGAASLDPDERAEGYAKFIDAWVETPPHIVPICVLHQSSGFQDGISGVTQSTSGATELRGVAKK